MSRIGKMPIKIPAGVKAELKGGIIRVEGPKGKLAHSLPVGIGARVEAGSVLVALEGGASEEKGALHGLTRTLLANMIHGVSTGFSRELEIVGVGFRAATKGNGLTLSVGYSHPIEYELPAGVSAKVENNTRIVLSSADKALLGLVAAKIRSFRTPEPYQGKGIRYQNEHIIRKQGKAAATSGGK